MFHQASVIFHFLRSHQDQELVKIAMADEHLYIVPPAPITGDAIPGSDTFVSHFFSPIGEIA